MNPEIQQLKSDIEALKTEFYKGNFSAHTDFDKTCHFNTRLKVPHYASVPTTFGEIGELLESGGILYICTATTPTYTKVGNQV